MNRSWKNNSNTSPGFVYFNVNNSYQNSASDTSDFLSFGDTPPRGSPKFSRFSPRNYSSPQKFQKSPRNFNKGNSYRYSGGYNNRSFNSSNSFNSSYNSNTRRESGPANRRKINSSGKKDMSMFFDHTSLKDPWAELEENLKKKKVAEALENSKTAEDKKEDPVVDNDDSSSGSEEESEMESKSSSSGIDEETT